MKKYTLLICTMNIKVTKRRWSSSRIQTANLQSSRHRWEPYRSPFLQQIFAPIFYRPSLNCLGLSIICLKLSIICLKLLLYCFRLSLFWFKLSLYCCFFTALSSLKNALATICSTHSRLFENFHLSPFYYSFWAEANL